MKMIQFALIAGLSTSVTLSAGAQQPETTLSSPSATPLGTPVATASPSATPDRAHGRNHRRGWRHKRDQVANGTQDNERAARRQRREERRRERNGTTTKQNQGKNGTATEPQAQQRTNATMASPTPNLTPQASPQQ